MSQELDTIGIVEDDNYMYGKMLPFLNIAGTKVERAMSWNSAMRLLKQSSNRIFWIVDGNFPKFDNEKK
jgi:DNA-binding NtrC family response regulator